MQVGNPGAGSYVENTPADKKPSGRIPLVPYLRVGGESWGHSDLCGREIVETPQEVSRGVDVMIVTQLFVHKYQGTLATSWLLDPGIMVMSPTHLVSAWCLGCFYGRALVFSPLGKKPPNILNNHQLAGNPSLWV